MKKTELLMLLLTALLLSSFAEKDYYNNIRLVTINDTLNKIVLEDNQDFFPNYLFKYPDIKILEMVDCFYNIIPREFDKLEQLEEFKITRCYNLDYKDLLQKLECNKKLTTLILRNDSLTTIPTAILNLTNLTKLDLTDNQISVIPNEVFRMKNLKQLYLSGNQVKEFETMGQDNNNINQLLLYECGLKEIPKGLGNFKGLKFLGLNSNTDLDLEEICEVIPHLENLEILMLFGINFNRLPPNVKNLSLVKNLIMFGSGLSKEDGVLLKEMGVRAMLLNE